MRRIKYQSLVRGIMSQEELTLLGVLGLIAELPADERKKTEDCISELRTLLAKYEDWGILAITLIGAELQVKAAEAGY